MQTDNVFISLKKLYFNISKNRRIHLYVLLFLMVLTSIVELISIGSIFPLLNVYTKPEVLLENKIAFEYLNYFNIYTSEQIILPITFLFIVIILFSTFVRLAFNWLQIKISFEIGGELSTGIYENVLHYPYRKHLSQNSSRVIANINKSNNLASNTILPSLNMLSSLIFLMMMLAMFTYYKPLLTIISISLIGTSYYLLTKFTRSKIKVNSEIISKESEQVIKSLQEGLGGIRDIILDGSQHIYTNIYRNADIPIRKSQISISLISLVPKYAIESLGLSAVAMVAYVIFKSTGSVADSIPILGLMALASQRILPILSQFFNNWTTLMGNDASLNDVLRMLMDKESKIFISNEEIHFNKSISLKNVDFSYDSSANFIFNNVNFSIKKGEIVGIIGASGSGKSTLIDIVMGLLDPVNGNLLVDGQKIDLNHMSVWRKNVAHVPQTIFLSDTTIAENIAFGLPHNEIDSDLVKHCCQKAQIDQFIEGLPQGYETRVGERGDLLSGGQRQRIGIARALYKKSKLLVLDEATSALDSKTESEVMKSIEMLGEEITIILVTHNPSLLKSCHSVFELHDHQLRQIMI